MGIMESDKKKVLGRGLASLIPDAETQSGQPPSVKKEFFNVDIEKIIPNTYQPRKIFGREALDELIESIKIHGVIQPLLVRHRGGNFELIAGERRWRAAQKAGLKQVPVVIREADDGASLELALIENIQRQDLNCIEEAIAYQQLVDEFQLSQEEVAARVGKNRVTVSNTMRLLKLPAVIREDITTNKLTMGHARSLLALESSEDQLSVREEIIKRKLSVRETERLVNDLIKSKAKGEAGIQAPREMDANLKSLINDFTRQFSVPVRLVGNEKMGFIQFNYSSKEVLMQLVDKLKGLGQDVPSTL